MKKTILSIFSLSSLLSFGQINITTADRPAIGYQTINVVDMTLSGINLGASGTDQVYDFSGFMIDAEDTIKYLDPSMTEFADNFPNSEMVRFGSSDSSMAYLSTTTTKLEIDGMLMPVPLGGSGNVLVIASDPLTQMTFPSTYLTSFDDAAELASSTIPFYQEISADPLTYFDSVRANVTYNRHSEIDGWGTIMTPFGTSFSVLRQVVTDIRTISPEFNMVTEVIPGFPVPLGYQSIPGTEITDTSVTYYFLTNAVGDVPSIIAEVTETGGVVSGAKFAKLPYAGLTETKNSTDAIVYPNPSKNDITVYAKETMNKVELFAFDGKMVAEYTPKATTMNISISALNPGNYFVKIYTDKGIATQKVVKQ